METCTDDIIFSIAFFLPPRDLANLALVSKNFGSVNNTTPSSSASNKKNKPASSSSSSSSSSNKQRQQGWPWSIMEEVSRRRVSSAKDNPKNPWKDSNLLTIRGEESWMAVDHRLHLLQSSHVFSRIIGSAIGYVNEYDVTHVHGRRRETIGFSVALCQGVMTSGRQYAEFTITENNGAMYMGITRPIHDWPKKKMRHREFSAYCRGRQSGCPGYAGSVHQYYYYANEDNRLEKGDVVGMLLDLDEGTLVVYKNGVCLGVMVDNLAGHYCWAVAIMNTKDGLTHSCYGQNKPSVRIGRGAMPGGS